MVKALFLVLTFLVFGCSKNPFGNSKADPNHRPGIVPPVVSEGKPSIDAEFVNSSGQLVQTLGGRFKVRAALGSATDQVQMLTSRGYELQSNIVSHHGENQ